MRIVGNFIDGKEIKSNSTRHGDIYNPNTGEIQGKVSLSSADELEAIVQSAIKAQKEWEHVNPQRRARIMFEFKSKIEANMDAKLGA